MESDGKSMVSVMMTVEEIEHLLSENDTEINSALVERDFKFVASLADFSYRLNRGLDEIRDRTVESQQVTIGPTVDPDDRDFDERTVFETAKEEIEARHKARTDAIRPTLEKYGSPKRRIGVRKQGSPKARMAVGLSPGTPIGYTTLKQGADMAPYLTIQQGVEMYGVPRETLNAWAYELGFGVRSRTPGSKRGIYIDCQKFESYWNNGLKDYWNRSRRNDGTKK